jgi:hypothetical protein
MAFASGKKKHIDPRDEVYVEPKHINWTEEGSDKYGN